MAHARTFRAQSGRRHRRARDAGRISWRPPFEDSCSSSTPSAAARAAAAAAALAAGTGGSLRRAAGISGERIGSAATTLCARGAARALAVAARLGAAGPLRALRLRRRVLSRGALCLRALRGSLAGGFGAVLVARLRAIGALLLRILRAVAPVLVEILAVILPVLARILAVVVVIVPGVVVHVAAAVESVRTVVIVVVHRRADRDARGEADQPRRDRGAGIIVFLDHDRGRRRLRVDALRVVLRHVDDLRVRRLDDDPLLARRGRLRLHLLLRVGRERSHALGLLAQLLDGVEDGGAIRGEDLAQPRGPGDLLRHRGDDRREQRQGDEARLEPGFHRL